MSFRRTSDPRPRRALTSRGRWAAAALVAVSAGAPALVATSAPASASSEQYFVAPWGSDSASGSRSRPFRTIEHAMETVRAGDTVVVRKGVYRERIRLRPAKGTKNARITVRSAPGEQPVLKGLLWLKEADYWTIDNLDVTWSRRNRGNEHMVKMSGGVGWRITGSKIYGARSYAAVLVSGSPRGWRIDHNSIHSTYRTNDRNQDHLIYVNAGMGAGVIERNTLAHSANGRGIKIGPSSPSRERIGNLVIRYNTFFDNRGPSNIQLSYGASKVRIYRNIFVRSGRFQPNVTAYRLNGFGNVVRNNVGWASSRVVERVPGLVDGGGNFRANPGFRIGFRTKSTRVEGYGRYGR
jgi:hypothetical protein